MPCLTLSEDELTRRGMIRARGASPVARIIHRLRLEWLEAERAADGGGVEDTVLLVPVALRAGEDQVAGVVGAEALGWGLPAFAVRGLVCAEAAEALVQLVGGQRDRVIDVETGRHIALRVDAELAHVAVLGEALAQDVVADLGKRGTLDRTRIEVEQLGVVVERLTLPTEELSEEPAVGFELEGGSLGALLSKVGVVQDASSAHNASTDEWSGTRADIGRKSGYGRDCHEHSDKRPVSKLWPNSDSSDWWSHGGHSARWDGPAWDYIFLPSMSGMPEC